MFQPVRAYRWYVLSPAGAIAAGPYDEAWQAFSFARRANRALGVTS